MQESGPQLLTQLHIILCTGRFTTTQIVSMAVSYFSLSLAACRAFYILRDAVHSDPDPSIPMLLHVMPYMMVVLAFNCLTWTFVFGVLKYWGALALVGVFFCNLATQKVKIFVSTIKAEIFNYRINGRVLESSSKNFHFVCTFFPL